MLCYSQDSPLYTVAFKRSISAKSVSTDESEMDKGKPTLISLSKPNHLHISSKVILAINLWPTAPVESMLECPKHHHSQLAIPQTVPVSRWKGLGFVSDFKCWIAQENWGGGEKRRAIRTLSRN